MRQSIVYFVVRVGCRHKAVHVRYLDNISDTLVPAVYTKR